MSRSKRISVAVLIVLIVIQFIQPSRNNSMKISATDITTSYNVPVEVQGLLVRACYDCHSNITIYPWYSNLQPFGWFVANDIKEGKEKLNFSEFGTYSTRRQMSKFRDIQKRIQDGKMPLTSYWLMHKSARLTKQDKDLFITWIDSVAEYNSENK